LKKAESRGQEAEGNVLQEVIFFKGFRPLLKTSQ
jgi:hypothetical protein